MRLFVAITDNDWFALHASANRADEVNFWRPSPTANFDALQPGEVLLYKLHSPENFIAGGGFFTRFLHLPVNLAWDVFKEANGVRSLDEMRARIAHYRSLKMGPEVNPTVGCILLAEPFFGHVNCGFRQSTTSTTSERRSGRLTTPNLASDANFGMR